MTIDKKLNITVYQYDYGVPVIFDAKYQKGWLNGDKVVFAIEGIEDKEYTVQFSDSVPDEEKVYSFEFKFTEEEAAALFGGEIPVNAYHQIPFSIKQHRDGVLLDTIKNAILYVRGTVPWQN